MQLLAKKDTANKRFGSPYAVLNVSRVGLRYFRILLNCSPASRDRLVKHFTNHPNVGWIFEAKGWCNLAVGIWGKDNAEIAYISSSIREVLRKGDEIVYQSELTNLYSFGDRPISGVVAPMVIVDAVSQPVDLSPAEFDYIKLLTMDSSLPSEEVSEIMGMDTKSIEDLHTKLVQKGIIVGTQERIQYGGIYYKVFVDSLSRRKLDSLEKLTEKLWNDSRCIYIERANGKYDFEFEVILPNSAALKPYLKDFSEYKTAILTKNLYTNLYPLNKTANLREIKEAFASQTGNVVDLRNSKLWYLNHAGADAYLSVFDNREYFEVMEKGEVDLFNEITTYLKSKNPDARFNLLDIGSGNGMKARVFIEHLGEELVKAYYPIDIQPIELAVALNSNVEGMYAKHPTLLNIENLSARFPLKIPPSERQVYIFFGGTYGNFPNSVINPNLTPLLDPSTSLLISMPITTQSITEAEIISMYMNLDVEEMAFGPAAQMGFKKEDFELNKQNNLLRIQPIFEDCRLVSTLVLANEVTLSGRRFDKGTVFKMMTSWKPTLEQFRDALEEDFSIEKMFTNDAMAIALVNHK